jgi:hypothetical protein
MPSSIINSDDGVVSGTSGLKSVGGDDGVLVFQSKGTETARINTDKQIVAAAGTNSLPALTTTGDLNTGIFFPAADTIAVTVGGVESARIVSGLLSIPANSTAASAVRLYEDTDNGTNYVDIIAPSAITSDRTLTIPDASGTIDRLNRAGNVLQVIQATLTTGLQTTSTSYVTTGLAATITPSSSSNKILISVAGGGLYAQDNNFAILTVYRGASDLFSGITYGATSQRVRSGQDALVSVGVFYLDSPATTSSTTYTVYLKASAGIVEYPSPSSANSARGTITLMEIAA